MFLSFRKANEPFTSFRRRKIIKTFRQSVAAGANLLETRTAESMGVISAWKENVIGGGSPFVIKP